MKTSIIFVAMICGSALSAYAQFFVHQSNGRVGIGNTSPAHPLDVTGVVNATAYYVNGIPFAGGGSQWITSGSNIYFNTGYTGVGTTTPQSRLHVSNSNAREALRVYLDGNTTNYLSMWQGAGAAAIDPIGTGEIYIGYDQTTDVFIGRNGGKTGINTDTPSSTLDVNGTTRLQNVVAASNNTYDIGSASNAFKDIHLDGKILFEDDKRIAMPGSNMFVGYQSGTSNTGYENTFLGYSTGTNATSAYRNVFVGAKAGYTTSTSSYNVFIGIESGYLNTSGSDNIFIGRVAGYSTSSGDGNVFIGGQTGSTNTTGFSNTAIGHGSAQNSSNLSNTTALGYSAVVTASNQIRVGNSSITSIGGQVSWSTLSDGRFKNDVQENVAGLDFINQLRPVSYTLNNEAYNTFLGVKPQEYGQLSDARKTPTRQTGFVAQEVEAIIKKSEYVFHGVEIPQNEKDPYTIRYGEFVVPLVKAVQELNAKVEEQQKIIDQLLNQKNNIAANEIEQTSFSGIRLFQNNPNPFSLDTKIKMSLPEKVNQALLIIYNL